MDRIHDNTGTVALLTSTRDEQMERVQSEQFDIERIVVRTNDDNVLVNALLEFSIVAAQSGTFEHVMDKTEYNKYQVVKAFALATNEEEKKQQFSVHYALAFDPASNKLLTDQLEIANYIDQID